MLQKIVCPVKNWLMEYILSDKEYLFFIGETIKKYQYLGIKANRFDVIANNRKNSKGKLFMAGLS